MNRKNLRKLANYLINLPVDYKYFDMRFFKIDKETKDEIEIGGQHDDFLSQTQIQPREVNVCNTVACALGHGPSAGIKPSDKDVTWWDYGHNHFLNNGSPEWDWCFGYDWVEVDNTPQGAGKRIIYLLENGLPKYWDLQMIGLNPISY